MIKPEAISLETLSGNLILSSKYILKEILKDFHRFNVNDIKNLLFIELRRSNPSLPDYIYKNILIELENKHHVKDILQFALSQISSKFFVWEKNNIYIHGENFAEWQNILTFIPPLQVLVYFFFEKNIQKEILIQYFKDKYSTLPSYYNPKVEYKIAGNLSDLHVHLNGTSETEYVWIDILGKPYLFIQELKKSFSKREVKELYKQFDIDFSPSVLFKLMKLARRIREFIVSKLKGYDIDNEKLIYLYFPIKDFNNIPLIPPQIPLTYNIHPYDRFEKYNNPLTDIISSQMHSENVLKFEQKRKNDLKQKVDNLKQSLNNPLIYEASFLYDAFKYMNNHNDVYLEKIFYIYLLLKSLLNRFLVQQLDQYGFDQFQKITLTELRELTEKEYKYRFLQLNSLYGKQLKHLEGRFTPKSDWKKLKKLVDKIIKDYETLKKQKKINYSLSLVAHFIKHKDKRKPESILTYRHYILRKEIKKQAVNLWNLIRWNPKRYLKYIKGIDAAANELHASPEVFAPTFRFLRRRLRNLPHFYIDHVNYKLGITFHAGEDFIHLVSGIRYIFEAVKFLDLSTGDRIGHGTAIGIDPKFWTRKVGNSIMIRKGEWLDNLLFVYYMIRDVKEFYHYLHKIEKEIEKYFFEIYREPLKNIDILLESYFCRAIDPNPKIFNKKESFLNNEKFFIYDIDKEELYPEKIIGFIPKDESLKLYRKYHQGNYIKEYEKIININPTYIIDINLMVFLQKKMVKILNSKDIAIETMPTSNVRISFYEDYSQHHIYRWIYEFEEIPNLVLCSDDPGIFSTNLRNEFLLTLRNIKSSDQERILNFLLTNSNIYAF